MIPRKLADRYRALFEGLIDRDRERIANAIEQIGFLKADDKPSIRERLIDLFLVVFEPLSHDGPFDFTEANIISRTQEMGMELAFKHGYMRAPPAETMFLHRKLDGTLLLCTRIKARVDVKRILTRVLEQTESNRG